MYEFPFWDLKYSLCKLLKNLNGGLMSCFRVRGSHSPVK